MSKNINITRFNYWEGWYLIKKDFSGDFDETQDEIFTFKTDELDEATKAFIEKKLKEVNKNFRSKITPKLIALDKKVLLNPIISEVIYNLSESVKKHKDDAKLLDEILKTIKGDRRGSISIKNLLPVINRDIKDFKEMTNKRLEGETVEKITDYTDTTLIKVWSAYNRLSKKIMQEFGLSETNKNDRQFIINILSTISGDLENKKIRLYALSYGHSQWILSNTDKVKRLLNTSKK